MRRVEVVPAGDADQLKQRITACIGFARPHPVRDSAALTVLAPGLASAPTAGAFRFWACPRTPCWPQRDASRRRLGSVETVFSGNANLEMAPDAHPMPAPALWRKQKSCSLKRTAAERGLRSGKQRNLNRSP